MRSASAPRYILLIMATLRQLAHAQALARLGSFRLAARELHLSQPALTRSIRALEEAFGVALFDRGPDGVAPTAFGEMFLRKSQTILLQHGDLVRDIRLMAGLQKGGLCVCAGPYPADVLVPRVAAALASAHPALAGKLRQGSWQEVSTQVLDRRADLGLAEISAAACDGRLQTEPLGQHRLFFYCRAGHPLLGMRELALEPVFGFPWVSTRLPGRMVEAVAGRRGAAGEVDPATGTWVPAWEVEMPATAKVIVAAGDGIGAAMLTQIEREVQEGTLAVLPYQPEWLRLDYGFVYLRERTLSPAARAFMDECRRAEAALAAREAALIERYGVCSAGGATVRPQA